MRQRLFSRNNNCLSHKEGWINNPAADYSLHMFIGPKALIFNSSQIVGYGKVDGLPRNEIADNDFALKMPIEKIVAVGKRKLRLGDILEHPALFAAYPGLKRTVVDITSEPDNQIDNGFGHNSGRVRMLTNPKVDSFMFYFSLSHEVQHAVQQIEGFKGGIDQHDFTVNCYKKLSDRLSARIARTNNKSLRTKSLALIAAAAIIEDGITCKPTAPVSLAINQLSLRAQRIYLKNEGEIEACATQHRLTMSDDERNAKPATHLLPAPPEAPQVRNYSSYEHDALRVYARQQKLVLLGRKLAQVFRFTAGKNLQKETRPAAMLRP